MSRKILNLKTLGLALLTAALGFSPSAPAVTQERVLPLPTGKMEFTEAGSGPNLIVLLHGFPESKHEWHAVIPHLSKDYKVVAVNLPGIGRWTSAAWSPMPTLRNMKNTPTPW